MIMHYSAHDQYALNIQYYYRIEVALDELEPDNNIKMKYTEHGSSRGAAFAAAMSKRQHIDQPSRLSSR